MRKGSVIHAFNRLRAAAPRRRAVAASLVVLAALVAGTAPAASAAGMKLTTKPRLLPGFNPSIPDYVSRCGKSRVLKIRVRAGGGRVSVDGRRARRGTFAVRARVRAGQRVAIKRRAGGRTATYHVRCLPRKFPTWRTKRGRRAKAAFYLLTPNGPGPSNYVVMFDRNGVPVYWRKAATAPFDASLLPNGNLIWSRYYTGDILGVRASQAYEEHTLGGRRVRVIKTVGSPTDFHDLQRLPGGNSLVLSYRERRDVDLRAYGGPRDATVLDGVVQEITPRGRVAWSWNSKNHISPGEQGQLQPPVELSNGQKVYDLVHLNSVEAHGDGRVLISARSTNALYDINRRTKKIAWKLGGTKTGASLRVFGDPAGGPEVFWRQHDARVLRNGTITIYDNATAQKRPPRAVRFRVDPSAGTATFLEQVTDPNSPPSNFAGSARKIAGGNWVVSWGGTPVISELTPGGDVVFRIRLQKGFFSYRVFPVERGRLSKKRLRRVMDARLRR